MLKKPQNVIVKCNPMNKSYYESKGYVCPKVGEEFNVNVEDLQVSSRVRVVVECDYCGKEFEMLMYAYTKSVSNSDKLACNCCKIEKMHNTIEKRYGVKNSMQIPEVKEKAKQTIIKNYGVDAPYKTPQHLEAMKHYDKNKAKENYIATCLEKYGVTNTAKLPSTIEKAKATCVKKYGGESSQCDSEVRKKSFQTLISKHGVPVSKVEEATINKFLEIYGEKQCIPQYNFGRCCFDCLLTIDGIKIDIEYDGRYWHDLHKEADKRRDYYTIRRGIKVLRFRGENTPPSKEQIINGVNYLVNSEHKHLTIEL